MKVKKTFKNLIILNVICIISLLFVSNRSLALSENCYLEGNKYKKIVTLRDSEKSEYEDNLENTMIVEPNKYSKENMSLISESENNTKLVTKNVEIKRLYDSNNELTIKHSLNQTFDYEDEEYKGTLNLEAISIDTVSQGYYEQIEKLDIDFKNYSQNELAKVDKTIQKNGYTWSLINVDWKADKTKVVDGTEVPLSYSGTKHYQRVGTYPNPSKYKVTAIYTGKVESKDKEYTYEINYTLVEPELEPESNLNLTTPIVIGAIGLLLILLGFLTKRNCYIYKKTTKGYKNLGGINLKQNNLKIDVSKFKREDGIYAIKINPNFFKKIKGRTACIICNSNKEEINLICNFFTINI